MYSLFFLLDVWFSGRTGVGRYEFDGGAVGAGAAEGVLRITNANMERAVRVVSVQRKLRSAGLLALPAFGDAYGLQACDLADSRDLATVLIPEHSGVPSRCACCSPTS